MPRIRADWMGMEIEYKGRTFSAHGNPMGDITALVNGKEIGTLEWEIESGVPTITFVDVCPEYQRRGIATTMLRRAEILVGTTIHHSNTRTDEGNAWSATTGNPRPSNTPDVSYVTCPEI